MYFVMRAVVVGGTNKFFACVICRVKITVFFSAIRTNGFLVTSRSSAGVFTEFSVFTAALFAFCLFFASGFTARANLFGLGYGIATLMHNLMRSVTVGYVNEFCACMIFGIKFSVLFTALVALSLFIASSNTARMYMRTGIFHFTCNKRRRCKQHCYT